MKIKADNGYTVVEVLTALVLLFLILTPATFIITRLLTTMDIMERQNANRICIYEAENALLRGNIKPLVKEQVQNGRRYSVQQIVDVQKNGLRLFSVTVSRHKRILSEVHHVLPATKEQ